MRNAMPTLSVYDPPMCCPTGVCGPRVDPVLPRFAADLDWLKQKGVAVSRFNPAQQPQAFAENAIVAAAVAAEPETALPLVLVDGRIVAKGAYPSRRDMAGWLGIEESAAPAPETGKGCCGPSGCC
jgi:arsenite methyltransferase